MNACGHPSTESGSCGTGYATLPDDRRVCYSCADALQALDMGQADKFYAYLSSDGRHVTTWTGGVLATVNQIGYGRTPTGGEVAYVRARDLSGAHWHGRGGGPGMHLSLTRRVER